MGTIPWFYFKNLSDLREGDLHQEKMIVALVRSSKPPCLAGGRNGARTFSLANYGKQKQPLVFWPPLRP